MAPSYKNITSASTRNNFQLRSKLSGVAGVSAMNTLQSHEEEFKAGIVTESGFSAINDAEGYGAASSIGAGSVCITSLWSAFRLGKSLRLFYRNKSIILPKTESDLVRWCELHFPVCYEEYLRRAKR